jgi:SagB-type dehydrogenase family enzyme
MKKWSLISRDKNSKAMELLTEYLRITCLQGKQVDEEQIPTKDWSALIQFSKTYPRFAKTYLSKVRSKAIYSSISKRKSVRKFDENYCLTVQDLSKVLTNSAVNLSDSDYPKRLFPSGGAMYPSNIYFLNLKSSDLNKGLYYYNPKEHCLEVLLENYEENEIRQIICDEQIQNPSALIILTTSYFKHCLKYGGRGFRYSLIEIGALAQMIDISCHDAGLNCVWLGGFDDILLKKLLDINDELEIELPVLVIALGKKDKLTLDVESTFG